MKLFAGAWYDSYQAPANSFILHPVRLR